MKKVVLSILLGIAVGCTIFVAICIGFILTGAQVSELWPGTTFIRQAIGGMIIGIAFSLPSLIYDSEKLSTALKVMIHMGIGMTVFSIAALNLGWVPVAHGWFAVFTFFAIAICSAFGIWGGFYIYYKNEAKQINQRIRERQQG